MRLRADQLGKHLKGEELLPVYLVAGDEPLQQDETLDALRSAARQRGFEERQRFSADTGIDWNALLNEAQSLSLFGGRRILEVVLNDKRPFIRSKGYVGPDRRWKDEAPVDTSGRRAGD